MLYYNPFRDRGTPSPAHDALAARRARGRRRAPSRRSSGAHVGASSRRRPPRASLARLVPAIALLLVALAVALRVASCVRSRQDVGAVTQAASPASASSYDWSCLAWSDDGRVAYVRDGTVLSRAGIDVSEHQGWIDWGAVAGAGIDFAIVRVGWRSATTGTLYQDDYAEYNLGAAPAAGLDVGVYFYSQATSADEAREEAEFVLSLLERLGVGTLAYPVVFDFEEGNVEGERIAGMSVEERTAVALAFCERIEEAGLSAMVYGNAWGLAQMDVGQLADRSIWYAEYGSAPTTDERIALWQYSETGSVAGVDGAVDLDLDLRGALTAAAGEGAAGEGATGEGASS